MINSTKSLIHILATLALLSAAPPLLAAAVTIEPGTNEYQNVENAIKHLRDRGETGAADELKEMLDNGEIYYNGDLDHPETGSGGPITLTGFQAGEGTSGIRLFDADSLEVRNLSRTLYHELIHAGQSGTQHYKSQFSYNYRNGENTIEVDAWNQTLALLAGWVVQDLQAYLDNPTLETARQARSTARELITYISDFSANGHYNAPPRVVTFWTGMTQNLRAMTGQLDREIEPLMNRTFSGQYADSTSLDEDYELAAAASLTTASDALIVEEQLTTARAELRELEVSVNQREAQTARAQENVDNATTTEARLEALESMPDPRVTRDIIRQRDEKAEAVHELEQAAAAARDKANQATNTANTVFNRYLNDRIQWYQAQLNDGALIEVDLPPDLQIDPATGSVIQAGSRPTRTTTRPGNYDTFLKNLDRIRVRYARTPPSDEQSFNPFGDDSQTVEFASLGPDYSGGFYGAVQSTNCSFAGTGTAEAIDSELVNVDYSSLGSMQYAFFPPADSLGASEWPNGHASYSDVGADQDPMRGSVPGTRNVVAGDANYALRGERYGSYNFMMPTMDLPLELHEFVEQEVDIGGDPYVSIVFDEYDRGVVEDIIQSARMSGYERNDCRVVLVPNDPNYLRTGRDGGNSWGARQDDQWAIKRVGFTEDENSAWNLVPESAQPVVVAVIDTGLDWHHLDIEGSSIWRNPREIPDNGIDDDRNGYVDDIIGWNFMAGDNRPWDFDGHGTVVTGIIAAAHNDVGIAGINPQAKIMVLKAVNNFGMTRASFLAEAIVYAVDNGAKIINISVGGPGNSQMERAAVDYARERGALIIAAAGNEGIELEDYGPGGGDGVLTVGATHLDNRAAAFSNFGDQVDLVAPGVDVLSLRARYTDANYRPGADGSIEYEIGDNYVGDDKRYLHVSGTSFSTPIVTGVASLVWSKNPALSAAAVEEYLTSTAADVDLAGKDKYTGHGMVDARAALSVEADFSVTAEITKLEPYPADAPAFIRVHGTIDASDFKRAWMQIGAGENPGGWRFVGAKRKYPIHDDTIGLIPLDNFNGAELWQVVVNVEHKNGILKRAVYPIRIR